MVKLSHMWERSEIGRFFRLDCVEARSQEETQTGPGAVTESGKGRESHRLGSVTETGRVTDSLTEIAGRSQPNRETDGYTDGERGRELLIERDRQLHRCGDRQLCRLRDRQLHRRGDR